MAVAGGLVYVGGYSISVDGMSTAIVLLKIASDTAFAIIGSDGILLFMTSLSRVDLKKVHLKTKFIWN